MANQFCGFATESQRSRDIVYTGGVLIDPQNPGGITSLHIYDLKPQGADPLVPDDLTLDVRRDLRLDEQLINGFGWTAAGTRHIITTGDEGMSIYEYVYYPAPSLSPTGWFRSRVGGPFQLGEIVVLNGYAWGNFKQIVYMTTGNGHIHEVSCPLGGSWQPPINLTATAGAPPAKADFDSSRPGTKPHGYGWEAGQTKQVVYAGTNNHIYELYSTGADKWHFADLSLLAGAAGQPLGDADPKGSFDAFGYSGFSWEYGRSKHVVWMTNDHHIHEISVGVGGSWGHTGDLHFKQPATVPLAGAIVNGYGWDYGQSKQVVFLPEDHQDENTVNLYEFSLRADQSRWVCNNLTTSATGTPQPPSEDWHYVYFPNGYAFEAGRSKHVVYAGVDLNLHELSFVQTGAAIPPPGWQDRVLTPFR